MNVMYSVKANDKTYKFSNYNLFKFKSEKLFEKNENLVLRYCLVPKNKKEKILAFEVGVYVGFFQKHYDFDSFFQFIIERNRNSLKETYRETMFEKNKIKNKNLKLCNTVLDDFLKRQECDMLLLNRFENELFNLYLLHDVKEELVGLKRIK